MFKQKRIVSIVMVAVFTLFTMLSIIPHNASAVSKKPQVIAAKVQTIVSGLKSYYYKDSKESIKLTAKNYKTVQYSVKILDSKKKLYKDITKGYTKALNSTIPYIVKLPTDRVGTFYINIYVKKSGARNYDSLWLKSYSVKAKTIINVNKNIDVAELNLNSNSQTLKVGDTFVIFAEISPEAATDKGIVWSSDNEGVAKVEYGTVTAVGEGSATITAAAGNGKITAECKITVEKAVVIVKDNTENEKVELIKLVISEIGALPEAGSITLDDKNKVSKARAMVEAAKAKGITNGDITNLKKLEDCELRIGAMEKALMEKLALIKGVVDAIASLPEANVITLGDKNKVANVRTNFELAKKAGIVDGDITNLKKLLDCEAGIAQLEKAAAEKLEKAAAEKAAAIRATIDAINLLPEANGVFLSDKVKIEEARKLVDAAKAKGAADSDITNLKKLIDCEARLVALQASVVIPGPSIDYKAVSVRAAIDAIAALPSLNLITIQDKSKVEAARGKVIAAKGYGAADVEITNLNILVQLETRITQLEAKAAAVMSAISAIAGLPEANAITLSDKNRVLAAASLVEAAINMGAAASEITNLGKLLDCQKRISELEKLPPNRMSVSATISGSKVTVVVNNNGLLNDTVAATITEQETGNLRFAAQKNLVNGAVTFEAALSNGKYNAAVKSLTTKEVITIELVVSNGSIGATGITLNYTTGKLNVGESLQLAGEVLPSYTTDKRIIWESEDTSIATVDVNGLVRGVKAGTTRINAYSSDRTVKAVCSIEITDRDAIAKQEAIKVAIDSIASLPEVGAVTLEDKTRIAESRAKVEDAKLKGAQDSDITNLQKLIELERTIDRLKAVAVAISAIVALPEASAVTLEDKARVEDAREKVKDAKAKGAVDADITNLGKLVELEVKIGDLEKAADKLSAINAAISAIEALPEVNLLTLGDKARVEAARAKVETAKLKGAVDTDITNLAKLAALETKLMDLAAGPIATVSINGTKVLITVTNSKVPNDIITVVIKDTNSQDVYSFDQKKLTEGIITFEVTLNAGAYSLFVSGTGWKIENVNFTVVAP